MMDQVLQLGPGERKEGVKTGAADSLVLACVQQQVDERSGAEAVVLATNDKRLRTVCSRLFGEDCYWLEARGSCSPSSMCSNQRQTNCTRKCKRPWKSSSRNPTPTSGSL